MFKRENYNPKQNYYFVDYGLEEHGHHEYLEMKKKIDPSHPDMGSPRWVRSPMNTEQDVQETMNFVFNSYPHKVDNLRIRSEKELNEVITIDEKTNKRIWEHDDEESYKKGLKLTKREYDFGGSYQWLYDHTTGIIDENGDLIGDDIPEGLNLVTRSKIKEKKGQK